MYLRDIFIIQSECFLYPSRLKSVSQHVRASFSLPTLSHIPALSEHSLQFEVRSTTPFSPFSFQLPPQLPCVYPNTKSLLQPTPFCGRLPNVHPLSHLPLAFCAQPSYPALPTTTLLYPTQHIFGKDLSCSQTVSIASEF